MVDILFTGYGGDCAVHGRLAIPDRLRLTDHLNDATTLTVRQVVLGAHGDGRTVELPELA